MSRPHFHTFLENCMGRLSHIRRCQRRDFRFQSSRYYKCRCRTRLCCCKWHEDRKYGCVDIRLCRNSDQFRFPTILQHTRIRMIQLCLRNADPSGDNGDFQRLYIHQNLKKTHGTDYYEIYTITCRSERPLHEVPLPSNPCLQVHLWENKVFSHVAFS